MAQYNYFISQEDLIQEPKIRVYTYESYPSREKRAEDRERYPSMYKIFNNKPSFGDTSVKSHQTPPKPSQDQVCISPRHHVPSEKAKFVGPGSLTTVAAYPKAYPKKIESAKYEDFGRVSQRPRSPLPHVGMQTRVPSEKAKFEGYKSESPVPLHNNVVTYPKAVPKTTVELVKYEKIGCDDKKKGGDFEEEECIDAAAAGFIEWKKRTLQMC